VNETAIFADKLGQMGKERNDVMFDLALNLVNAGNVKFGRTAALPDIFGGVFRDDADLCKGVVLSALDKSPPKRSSPLCDS